MKYAVLDTMDIKYNQTIEIQSNRILGLGKNDYGGLLLFFVKDTDIPLIKYNIRMVVTGTVIEFDIDKFKFLGTIDTDDFDLSLIGVSALMQVFYRKLD